LAEWLPEALKYMREDIAHGYPAGLEEENQIQVIGFGEDKIYKDGMEKWKAIFNKMIDGFEAYNRLQGSPSTYEKEVGWEYPLSDFKGNVWVSHPDTAKWHEEVKPFEERDKKLWKEGMALFVEYFQSLWD
jgi:hypothetical protein